MNYKHTVMFMIDELSRLVNGDRKTTNGEQTVTAKPSTESKRRTLGKQVEKCM
jgi:hypothetical protein